MRKTKMKIKRGTKIPDVFERPRYSYTSTKTMGIQPDVCLRMECRFWNMGCKKEMCCNVRNKPRRQQCMIPKGCPYSAFHAIDDDHVKLMTTLGICKGSKCEKLAKK